MNQLLDFYNQKKILITGHTGFKGAWMCKVLELAGAEVVGYSLQPPTKPNLYDLTTSRSSIKSVHGDVRDLEHLLSVFQEENPEIVIHMAAQPIVRESYKNPVYTYDTNVMGTVNVLECIRHCNSVKSFINVTTDKVYLNKEWEWGYRENEELNGYDPYSNSKSCSELVTSSYKKSFFYDRDIAISTCRAGNVIGGGDFALDRIIPDCIRAIEHKTPIVVRNPYSIRPYQHVLEPVMAYLTIAMKQYSDTKYSGAYNIGPDETDCWMTGRLVELFCQMWKEKTGESVSWIDKSDGGPHEANFLKLDCSRVKTIFGWKPRWNVVECVEKIVEWTVEYEMGNNVDQIMVDQINNFLAV